MTGHVDRVWSVATAVVEGRALAVTSGDDGTVRVWDMVTGEQVGEPSSDPAAGCARWRRRWWTVTPSWSAAPVGGCGCGIWSA